MTIAKELDSGTLMTLNDDDDQVQPYQNARMLENELLRYHLDILGVSKARWLGSGTVNDFAEFFHQPTKHQQCLGLELIN